MLSDSEVWLSIFSSFSSADVVTQNIFH